MQIDFHSLLRIIHLKRLKKVTIFENFSEHYAYITSYARTLSRGLARGLGRDVLSAFPMIEVNPFTYDRSCSRIRTPNPTIGRELSFLSQHFESFAASFMVDANEFFNSASRETSHHWPNLRFITLTTQLLSPGSSHESIMDMFVAAAWAAKRMPRLETLEIWNGQRRLAALFRYDRKGDLHPAVITWRGTWDLTFSDAVIDSWQSVTETWTTYGMKQVYETVDGYGIQSHADAIIQLRLPEMVVRPVSLQQIRREQKFGWDWIRARDPPSIFDPLRKLHAPSGFWDTFFLRL